MKRRKGVSGEEERRREETETAKPIQIRGRNTEVDPAASVKEDPIDEERRRKER